jgi:hypothetical protein
MLVSLNAAEFKSIPLKKSPCRFYEIVSCVQPEYCTPGLASISRFQKGCH